MEQQQAEEFEQVEESSELLLECEHRLPALDWVTFLEWLRLLRLVPMLGSVFGAFVIIIVEL